MKGLTQAQQNIRILKRFSELNVMMVEYEEISSTVAGIWFDGRLITYPIKIMKPEKVIELLNHQVKILNKQKRGTYIEYSE